METPLMGGQGRQMQVGYAEIEIPDQYLASLCAVNTANSHVLSTQWCQTVASCDTYHW